MLCFVFLIFVQMINFHHFLIVGARITWNSTAGLY